MGEVKNGTVSGVLPSIEAFVVHYPGYPSSTTRAVETLGGIEGIIKAHTRQLCFFFFFN
jgi:general transcription factor 3C polypeptide 5 (transcription factor C subunit 1)